MYQERCVVFFKKSLVLVRDAKLEGGRQRHPSGGAREMVIGLEGVELGADGKVRNQQICVCVVDQYRLVCLLGHFTGYLIQKS